MIGHHFDKLYILPRPGFLDDYLKDTHYTSKPTMIIRNIMAFSPEITLMCKGWRIALDTCIEFFTCIYLMARLCKAKRWYLYY